jgi:hypothetical protein
MGNKITIKNDVKLVNDGTYVHIQYDKCFAKKITSRAFPALIGKDDYKSEGVEIMGLLNLLEKSDDIDPFYMFRGDVAEHFVGQAVADFFGRKFGKENVEVIIFADKQFTYGDQWHYDKETQKGNKDFGGRIDIGVKVKTKDGTVKGYVIEVKSKTHTKYETVDITNETTGETAKNTIVSKSDYQTIAVERKYPETEVQQGIFLANMSNLSSVTMFWVFFNEKQEQELKELTATYLKEKKIPLLSFDYTNVVYHSDTIEFNRDTIWRDMLVSSNNIKKMAREKKIPLFMFKASDIKAIDQHIAEYERIQDLRGDYDSLENDTPIPGVAEEDLPF